MDIFYWLSLIGFVSLLALSGLFRSHITADLELRSSIDLGQMGLISKPHPFLLEERVDIKKASVADIASIKGISHKRAREIAEFLQKNPQANLDDLVKITGIGPKMIVRLRDHFF